MKRADGIDIMILKIAVSLPIMSYTVAMRTNDNRERRISFYGKFFIYYRPKMKEGSENIRPFLYYYLLIK